MDNIFADTNATHILGLLQSNAVFVVPRFQRDYAWKVDRVAALWNDLLANYRESKDSRDPKDVQYLLGPMVLTRTERQGVFSVIDGQQRLATLTMLFCAARNIIHDEVRDGNAEKPEDLGKIKGLIQNTSGGEFNGWKLELNDTDKDAFRKIQGFDEGEDDQWDRIKKIPSKPSSLKLLKSNYKFLHDKLTDSLKTNFDGIYTPKQSAKQKDGDLRVEMLMDFLTHVIENNFIIKIMVEKHSTAFQIFETLNERGQSLTKSDLIKNHVINMVGGEEKKREFSNKWNKIFKEIISNNQRDDDFIMESYHSRYGDSKSLRTRSGKNLLPMSKKNLYNIIKSMTENDKECAMLVEELTSDAQFLSTLDDPSGYADTKTKGNVMAMKQLKARFIRVPMLAAYRKWYDDYKANDYTRLVKLLVKYFFKTRVVMQQHPGIIEKNMAEITKMINSGESLESIVTKLREYDQHKEFLHSFSRFMADEPTKSVAKYILSEITVHMGSKYPDVRPVDDLTLEHILPQDFKKWDRRAFMEGYTKDDKMQDFVTRLGNMTLLHIALNAGAQNEPFVKKLEYYRNSDLKLNKAICRLPRWTAVVIEEREKEFKRHADKIWSLD